MSDIVERYKRLVATGFKYAESEKRQAPTSVFEIYVGHFKDIGEELEAEITRLTRELEEARAAADENTLLRIVADIRQKTGVGMKPMLSELADAIAAKLSTNRIEALEEAAKVAGRF